MPDYPLNSIRLKSYLDEKGLHWRVQIYRSGGCALTSRPGWYLCNSKAFTSKPEAEATARRLAAQFKTEFIGGEFYV